jgi:hypothetical protein
MNQTDLLRERKPIAAHDLLSLRALHELHELLRSLLLLGRLQNSGSLL